jgi:hypothetical protein
MQNQVDDYEDESVFAVVDSESSRDRRSYVHKVSNYSLPREVPEGRLRDFEPQYVDLLYLPKIPRT